MSDHIRKITYQRCQEALNEPTSAYTTLYRATRTRAFFEWSQIGRLPLASLGVPLVLCHKTRAKANVVDTMQIIGDVQGKNAILVDDIVDTAGTIS